MTLKPVHFFIQMNKGFSINQEQFELLVHRALEEIPQEFLDKIKNVEIFIEKYPSPELKRKLGLGEKDLLFGLYQGVPRPEKSFFQPIHLPDRITLFIEPMLNTCNSEEQLQRRIRKTLIHEVAHFFGFSEEKIRRLGY